MKKFIIASMVAIAMLVGVQPVFAAQFIVPEVSASDSQCYVLDLPAGATAEAPKYAAPWQVPEINEVSSVMATQTDYFIFTPFNIDFDVPSITSVYVSISFTSITTKIQYYIEGVPVSGDENVELDSGEISSLSGMTGYFHSSVALSSIIVRSTTPSLSYGGVSITY